MGGCTCVIALVLILYALMDINRALSDEIVSYMISYKQLSPSDIQAATVNAPKLAVGISGLDLELNSYFSIKSYVMTDENLEATDDLQKCTDEQLNYMPDASKAKFSNSMCYKEDQTV